ncbi:MAG TPA: amidase [Chloroflexota bacterium]
MTAPIDALRLEDAARAIAARQLSPVDLVRALIARIERFEPTIQAWAYLDPERALHQAREREAQAARGDLLGPLHGVPLGIKDIFFTADQETSAGSRILKGFVPSYDATVVARLKARGAIILGKTHTTEFAAFDPAPTRNPWNPAHTPGGSSSGSAAAVAARMCPGAFGSQTAGSILRPAAYCGVVGLKPTYGRISRHGIIPFAWTVDHPGPIARTVRDAAILLEATAGADPHDPTCAVVPVGRYRAACEEGAAGLRAGVPDRFFLDRADPEVSSAYHRSLDVLRKAGLDVREVALPAELEAAIEAHRVIMYAEAAAVHHDWLATRAEEYSPKLRGILEAGRQIPATAYLRAQQVRAVFARAMRRLFEQTDLLALPATPTPAPEGLGSTGDPIFNVLATTIGFPAIAVPCGISTAGLPIGLQLVARPFEEATLLRAAATFEAASGFSDLQPPLEQLG